MTRFQNELEEAIPALRRYARAMTGNAERADDLVQDCVERALRKQDLWRAEGPLKSWLMTMLVNIYRNDLRREKRAPHLQTFDGEHNEPGAAPGQPSHMALAEIARAIGSLSPDQRETLNMVVLEGLSYAEAAKILQIPIGTFMSRLSRARARLRELTNDEPRPVLRRIK